MEDFTDRQVAHTVGLLDHHESRPRKLVFVQEVLILKQVYGMCL